MIKLIIFLDYFIIFFKQNNNFTYKWLYLYKNKHPFGFLTFNLFIMTNFTKFFTGSFVIAFAFVMFSFTTANQKNLANVASNAQALNQPNEEYCFEGNNGDVYFYVILEIDDDGYFSGAVGASDGTDSDSRELNGYIEGDIMYLDGGGEWEITEDGIIASDGTYLENVDC